MEKMVHSNLYLKQLIFISFLSNLDSRRWNEVINLRKSGWQICRRRAHEHVWDPETKGVRHKVGAYADRMTVS